MSVYVVFTATNEVFSRGNAPTAGAIQAALQRVQTTANTAPAAARPLQLGDWVGGPRITRVAILVSTGGRKTRVAWLHEFPDLTDDPRLQNEAARYEAIRRERLRTQGLQNLRQYAGGDGWRDALVSTYNPAINGPVEWWRNGQAADTHTRDAFDLNQQLGSSTEENAVGPDVTHPPTPFGTGTGLGDALNALKWIVIVGGAIYLVGPAVRGISSLIGRNTSARANPARARRRRGRR